MNRIVTSDGLVPCPFRVMPSVETCMACPLFKRFRSVRRGIDVRCRAPWSGSQRRGPTVQMSR